MPFNPDIHHRKSHRMQGYDYCRPGAYFITIVTANRECLFGEVRRGNMLLNTSGDIIEEHWRALPDRYDGVSLGEFIIMPNHIHGILNIDGNQVNGENQGNGDNQGAASGAPTVGAIIRCFKSRSAIAVNRSCHREGVPVWQRNYWERIVRDKLELQAFRAYIRNNPKQWHADQLFT